MIHQPADQPIEPTEFLNRISPIRFLVAEMPVAVEDHAEGRGAQVVPQCTLQGIDGREGQAFLIIGKEPISSSAGNREVVDGL